jgi:Protein of unknown function (DUF4012)
MSAKLISLDIQRGQGNVIDITVFFPLSEAHPITHTRHAHLIDDMHIVREDVDLSEDYHITIERFRTIGTLDIAREDLRRTSYWQKTLLDTPDYQRIIVLIDPLAIPYGALDIRTSEQIRSERRYPDLYTRRLPYGLMCRRVSHHSRRYIARHRRGILGTILTWVIVIAPVLWYVKFSVESGYQILQNLPQSHGIAEIRADIREARGYFERANFLFFPFSWIPNDTVRLADHATRGGLYLTRAMDELLRLVPTESWAVNSVDRSTDVGPTYRAEAKDYFFWEKYGIDTPTDWLEQNASQIDSIIGLMETAGEVYGSTQWDGIYAKKMRSLGGGITRVTHGLRFYDAHRAQMLALLGHDEPERYVIFNQNRDEIRANGGFPGSILSLTLYKGNILDYRKDDVYYYDWNLYPYKEIPPPGIALLTTNFGLRDVNYYPDFRETLEKANEFIERSGDSTITTGIAVHQWTLEEMLRITGPVSVSGVTIPFDAENFSLLMSTLVEAQYHRDLHPKGILFDFIEAFGKQAIQSGKFDELARVLEHAWWSGEILMASRDPEVDSFIANYRNKLPWESDEKNWAYPVTTSVSGNKSDRYIDRKYTLRSKPIVGCLSENILDITHTHTFTKQDHDALSQYMKEFDIPDTDAQKKMRFIQWEGKNRAFVRVYTPLGSTLAYTGGGIQVTNNEHATVFSFTLDTDVGQTSTKTLRYAVNIPDCTTTSSSGTIWRQPWLRNAEYITQ